MSPALAVVSGLLLLTGALFTVIGGIGILRMPDVITRMHAAGITDTIGAGTTIAGLMIIAGWSLLLVKLAVLLVFLLLLSPTASHALARATIPGTRRPWLGGPGDGQ
ncbi:MAG: monovalent cation/H(+) antiporter subunit G [Pseudomonadota bacterium]|nr:monovalent cation/H(+) antiporter subunit G [Pseudomonadota bacterium]